MFGGMLKWQLCMAIDAYLKSPLVYYTTEWNAELALIFVFNQKVT